MACNFGIEKLHENSDIRRNRDTGCWSFKKSFNLNYIQCFEFRNVQFSFIEQQGFNNWDSLLNHHLCIMSKKGNLNFLFSFNWIFQMKQQIKFSERKHIRSHVLWTALKKMKTSVHINISLNIFIFNISKIFDLFWY